MEASEQELKKLYEGMETDQLVRLYQEGGLTEIALLALKNALASRNVKLDGLQKQALLDQGKKPFGNVCDPLRCDPWRSYPWKCHPWRRFFARTADLVLVGSIVSILGSFLVVYLFPGQVAGFQKTLENPASAWIVFYLFWLPVEAVFLATLGTTPAKSVFGIHVLSTDGGKLSYSDALRRALLLFIQGEGLGIPPITIFTRIFAYRRLTKTGTTLWDTSVGSVVTHKKWGIIRSISSVLVVLATLIMLTLLREANH